MSALFIPATLPWLVGSHVLRVLERLCMCVCVLIIKFVHLQLDQYRRDQLSVMNASLSGHDVILIMPTGGGKSLCYQLPAVISKVVINFCF